MSFNREELERAMGRLSRRFIERNCDVLEVISINNQKTIFLWCPKQWVAPEGSKVISTFNGKQYVAESVARHPSECSRNAETAPVGFVEGIVVEESYKNFMEKFTHTTNTLETQINMQEEAFNISQERKLFPLIENDLENFYSKEQVYKP